MASHRIKRAYVPSSSQPTITTFFNGASGAESESCSPSGSAGSNGLAPVPPAIQSSLLNVGMRVRKSVPEGYKTHKTVAAPRSQVLAPPPPSSAPPSLSHQRMAAAAQASQGQPRAPRLIRSGSDRRRELQPFCGLHAVGGHMLSQGPYSDEDQEGEGVPGLTWSQPTLGTGSSIGGSFNGLEVETKSEKKRSYEEEVEDDLDAFFGDEDGDMISSGAATSTRPIAPLKGGSGVRRAPRTNMPAHTSGPLVHGDFDDRDVGFLQPMDVDT